MTHVNNYSLSIYYVPGTVLDRLNKPIKNHIKCQYVNKNNYITIAPHGQMMRSSCYKDFPIYYHWILTTASKQSAEVYLECIGLQPSLLDEMQGLIPENQSLNPGSMNTSSYEFLDKVCIVWALRHPSSLLLTFLMYKMWVMVNHCFIKLDWG